MESAVCAPATAGEPVLERRRALIAACGAHVVHDGLADALYVLLPIWASAFGLSYAAAGLVKTVFSCAFATLQMPAGMLAERSGERGLLGLGTIVAGGAFALTALAPSYAALLALVLLSAVGSTVQHPIGSALLARAYDAAARRAALSLYNFTGDVGKMLAAAFIGIGATYLGWRNVVLCFGLLVVATGLAVLRLLPGPGNRADRTGGGGAASAGVVAVPGFGFTNGTGFALLAGIQVVDSAVRVAVLTFVPFLLVSKGADAATAGLALTLIFLGGAAGKLVCGLLAERIGIIRSVVATELLTAALVMAVVLLPLGLVMALLPLLGLVLNGTSSVLYGTVSEFVHADRQARAFGLFYSLGSTAGAAAPVLFGLLGDSAGLAAALSTVAALVLATLPLAAALARHLGRPAAAA